MTEKDYTIGDTPKSKFYGEDNWKHRSDKMRCRTCMFFVPKISINMEEKSVLLGRCRERSPTMKGWPVMFATDWCGAHKIDENKI